MLHTPGHTLDASVPTSRSRGLLFSSDTVFANGTLSRIAAPRQHRVMDESKILFEVLAKEEPRSRTVERLLKVPWSGMTSPAKSPQAKQ